MEVDFEKLKEMSKEEFTQKEIDESMIRSYMHSNPLVKYISFKRIKTAMKLGSVAGRVVYDFGCGIGVLFPYLKDAKKIYAYDLKDELAKETAMDLGISVDFVKLEDMPDGSIDTFIALDVLEHIKNHRVFLRTLKRKLNKGSIIIVSLPTETWFYKLCRKIAGYDKSAHYHRSNPEEIAEMLKSKVKNYQVKKIPFGMPLFQIIVMNTLKWIR